MYPNCSKRITCDTSDECRVGEDEQEPDCKTQSSVTRAKEIKRNIRSDQLSLAKGHLTEFEP